MSNRSTIVMAVLTFGSIALTAATLVGAYTVMDERAERIFNAQPRAMPAEKRSASARSEGTMVRGGGTQTARGVSASKPRTTAPTERQTVGSAAAASAAAPPPASQRGNTAETRPAPAAMPEGQPQRRAEAHHGRKPARRLARTSQELQAGGAGASQGAQNGGQSAFFFPFR